MKNSCRIFSLFLLVFIALLNLSCASTRDTTTWVDSEYQEGPFKKIVVIGLFRNFSSRKEFEKEIELDVYRPNIAGLMGAFGAALLAKELNIKNAKGGLLPEDKLNEVEILKKNPENKIAFIGDGINDAPVLAASNVGIAMGGLGSDVAIETADVIIQTDQPSKVVRAIKISRSTRKIVWQNIILAFGVKVIVLILGAGGLATMWEAVFADVGVALLAILNAVRIQKMKF